MSKEAVLAGKQQQPASVWLCVYRAMTACYRRMTACYRGMTACYRCMAAVQCFTDSAATSSSQEAKGLQHVLLGAGTEAALRAAAQQSPTWVGGSAGQGRLKTALAALQETTHAPGILPPISLHCDYIVDSYS